MNRSFLLSLISLRPPLPLSFFFNSSTAYASFRDRGFLDFLQTVFLPKVIVSLICNIFRNTDDFYKKSSFVKSECMEDEDLCPVICVISRTVGG